VDKVFKLILKGITVAKKKKAALKTMRLSEFAIFQNSKFLAVLYFLISIPVALIFALMLMSIPADKPHLSALFMIFVPFLYSAGAFLFSALGFAIYNWMVGFMGGGIEFKVEQK
jgi:hypothetical protein